MLGEHHDVTEWLPRSFTDEYPHRAAQADITHNRGSITTNLGLYPVDILLAKNVITYDHHESAMKLVTVRKAIRNSLGVDRTFEMFSPKNGECLTSITATALLTHALRGLTRTQITLLDKITTIPKEKPCPPDRPMTMDEVRWVSHCCAQVQDILNKLKINIDSYLDMCASSPCEGGISVPSV